jgi:mRNA interferase RelE/StbE
MTQAAYRLRIPQSVAALVRGMHPHLKRKVRAALKQILSNPNEGQSLKGELAGLRSFRVSRFRIIYRIQKNHVELVAIGPRKRIYEETFYVLKKEAQE